MMALAALTTIDKVAAKSAVDTPGIGTADRDSIEQAVDEATAIVYGFLRRDSIATLRPSARATIEAVATRVASRFYRNPQEIGSTSYNEVSVSYSDPRILTGDEKAALSPWVARRRAPIGLNPSPDLEDLTWTTW